MAELTPQGSEGRAYIGVPNKLRYTDQKALCSLACMCQHAPDISRSGQNLKQNCMARNLDTVNRVQPSKAHYKPEVSYDMTQRPPAPILESNPPAGQEPQKHGSWLGWLSKHWDDPEVGRPKYRPGTQQIRRPDIIIVDDPLKSPVQSNIYQVVEVKFPGDIMRPRQREHYEIIAGDKRRLVILNVDECECDNNQREKVPEPLTTLESSANTQPYFDQETQELIAEGAATGLLGGLMSIVAASVVLP